MSDETSQAPEPSPESAPAAPRVRRISNPRPKKAAAKAEPEAADSAPAPDWQEPETISDSRDEGGDAKRNNKRRRRKGKGNNKGQTREVSDAPVGGEDAPPMPVFVESAEAEISASAPAEQPAPAAKPVNVPQSQPQPPQQPRPQHQGQPRTPVDPQVLAKKAWKIFLAEVSEEGVSLISDQDARELSRRCFRLAEIFLDEQGRRAR